MDAFTAIKFAPWAIACALAFKLLLDKKDMLDPHSWEVNLMVLFFGWLVRVSFYFHKMALVEISPVVHRACEKLGPLHSLRSHFIVRHLIQEILLLFTIVVKLCSAICLRATIAVFCKDLPLEDFLDNYGIYYRFSSDLALTICSVLLCRRVPHDWVAVRYVFVAFGLALAPIYVVGLVMFLDRVPPLAAMMVLGAKWG